MKSIITVFVALATMSLTAYAGAPGDSNSDPYALCSGVLTNQQTVQVEIRSWSFPFRLTGSVLLGNISEPVGINHSSGASRLSSRQSRPVRLAADIQLQRDSQRNLAGTIEVVLLGSNSRLSGVLNCKYANQ
jgi:hypothetical protein